MTSLFFSDLNHLSFEDKTTEQNQFLVALKMCNVNVKCKSYGRAVSVGYVDVSNMGPSLYIGSVRGRKCIHV
jgi:hypothetical protein